MTGSVCPCLGDRSHSRAHTNTHTNAYRIKQIRGLDRKTHAHMPCTYRDRHTQNTRIHTRAYTYTDTSGSTEAQKTSRDVDSSLEIDELGASTREAT